MLFRVHGLNMQGGGSTLHNPEQVSGAFIWKCGVDPLSIILNKCLAASSGNVCSPKSVSCMHWPKGASLLPPRCSEGKMLCKAWRGRPGSLRNPIKNLKRLHLEMFALRLEMSALQASRPEDARKTKESQIYSKRYLSEGHP